MVRNPALSIIHTEFFKHCPFSENSDYLELGISGHSVALILITKLRNSGQ